MMDDDATSKDSKEKSTYLEPQSEENQDLG